MMFKWRWVDFFAAALCGISAAYLLAWSNGAEGNDHVYLLVGIEHTSSPMNGRPVNNDEESSYDMPYVGVKYYKQSWDMNFQFDVAHIIQDDELYGDNPRFQFTIEKQFRIK